MNTETNETPTTLNYTTFSIELTKLPPASLHRLASYGLAHYLGNQAASKVVAWAEKFETDNKRAPTDEEKSARKTEVQNTMFAAVLSGEMGVHASRGPAIDPEDAEMERLAKAEILATLKANNIKAPKKDEAVTFGDGTQKTMEAMIDTRLERHGERLRTEAKASLKAKAKAKEAAAKKLAATVAGAGAVDL